MKCQIYWLGKEGEMMLEVNLKRVSSQTIKYELLQNGKLLRDFEINQYYTYVVDSIRDSQNRHQGRHCIIMEFDGDIRASVKFTDNGRRGKINLEDLSIIEDNKTKIEKFTLTKQENERLLNEALMELEELTKKIEHYRTEILKSDFNIRKLH